MCLGNINIQGQDIIVLMFELRRRLLNSVKFSWRSLTSSKFIELNMSSLPAGHETLTGLATAQQLEISQRQKRIIFNKMFL
jgi:hypothetical protein